MGSDMYMASQSFRPRPDRARWEGDKLVVERDYFEVGYKQLWKGNPKGHEALLKAFHIEVPPFPSDHEVEVRALATQLHEVGCQWDHMEGCAWYYENDNADGWGKDRWDNPMRAHHRWLLKARTLRGRLPEFTNDEIVKLSEDFQ